MKARLVLSNKMIIKIVDLNNIDKFIAQLPIKIETGNRENKKNKKLSLFIIFFTACNLIIFKLCRFIIF